MMLRIRIRRLAAIVLPAVVALVLALGVPLGTSRATSTIPSVPFAAYYTETYALPPCTPLACPYPGQGTGFTTATGAMNETTLLTLRPGPSSTCKTAQGQTTFTDAQGNQLRASTSGSACPTSSTGPLAVQLSFTISGGTGRFSSAGGNGTASGWVYLQNTVGRPVGAFVWKGFYTPCLPCG
jgi:hypothetical protein